MLYRSVMLLGLLAAAAGGRQAPAPGTSTSAGGTPAPAGAAQQLPLRRVVLYKAGVGYFEHDGVVTGNAQIAITLTDAQLNDVLNSLTALDLGGGRIAGANYTNADPAAHQLAALPLPLASRNTLVSLLEGLRGAALSVERGGTAASGRLLSVEAQPAAGRAGEHDALSLLTSAGTVRTFTLDEETRLHFDDSAIEQELNRGLGLLDASHAAGTRQLLLTADGSGRRSLAVSYVSEVPVWKTTYRIVLPAEAGAPAVLQGWAVVDNTVGEDWDNVTLSLAAGAPQSFLQPISQPLYTRRPTVPVPVGYMTTPQTHAATMASGPGSVTGIISDASGAGVGAVQVQLQDESGRVLMQTRSDAAGRFTFANVPPGAYQVSAARAGFASARVPGIAVDAGFAANADIELQAATGAPVFYSGSEAAAPATAAGFMLGRVGGGGAGGFGNGAGGNCDPTREADCVMNATADDASEPPAPGAAGGAHGLLAFPAQAPPATTAAPGELFEYNIAGPVTIHKNESALVPILQAAVEVERVSLWNPQQGSPHPARALWLTNGSGMVLDGGSFSIVDGGAFGGQGLLDAIQPGERRLISYATDAGMTIAVHRQPAPERLIRVRAENGGIIRTDQSRQLTVYEARNGDAAARTLVLEQPIMAGWDLNPAMHPDERTAAAYRFRLPVAAQSSASLTVETDRQQDATIAAVNFDAGTMAEFTSAKVLNAAAQTQLEGLLAQQQAIAALQTSLTAAEAKHDSLTADQERVRADLNALKDTPDERALIARYVDELNNQETQIAAAQNTIAALNAQLDQARTGLGTLIAHLDFDSGP